MEYNVFPKQLSGLRKNSIACVALNTCGLAFAEAERYLPTLISKIETILEEEGLIDDEISIRMTGCANGCGRPYLGEIALIGKALGQYNLYLGGSFKGLRINNLYKENIAEPEILDSLTLIFQDFVKERKTNEYFGDFIIRRKYVSEIIKGSDFKH